jgi:lysozyme family protein
MTPLGSKFDAAVSYVIQNEGGYTNNAADSGGKTIYGITAQDAIRHGYTPGNVTLDQAKAIYLSDYWKFDGITDWRVAAKMLDMVVNMGFGTHLIQRAAGVAEDGVYGPLTEAALNAMTPDAALEALSLASAEYYVRICLKNTTQLVFLLGWVRRSVRRPQQSA